MHYKGMVARHEYIARVGCFVGEIINCPDVVSFTAKTLAELQEAMQAAVDRYVEYRKFQIKHQSLSHQESTVVSYRESRT